MDIGSPYSTISVLNTTDDSRYVYVTTKNGIKKIDMENFILLSYYDLGYEINYKGLSYDNKVDHLLVCSNKDAKIDFFFK